MNNPFEILKKNRALILKITDDFTLDQLNKIPNGFGNNIIWNMAHLVVIQEILCYKLSGLPMHISDDMAAKYMKGSRPTVDVSQEEVDEIKELLVSLPNQFEKDYNANIFKKYEAYTTSLNVTLVDIDTAITFNNFHEGIHLGVILALRKLV